MNDGTTATARNHEMTSGNITGGENNVNSQETLGWNSYQQYPPPEALPEYINRALPRRPNSSSSSVYDSPDGETPRQPAPFFQASTSQYHDDDPSSPGPAGILDEAGLALVQPLQQQQSIAGISPSQPPLRQGRPSESEIAAPQPRHPTHIILGGSRDSGDYVVSPVSAPLPGTNNNNNNIQPYEVSPISPGDSQRSLHSATVSPSIRDTGSVASRHSSLLPITTAGGANLSQQPGRIHVPLSIYADSQSSRSLLAARDGGLHGSSGSLYGSRQQEENQIRHHSDPGSPITGAVIRPPTSFPSDPNLRSPTRRSTMVHMEPFLVSPLAQQPQMQLPLRSARRSPNSRDKGSDDDDAYAEPRRRSRSPSAPIAGTSTSGDTNSIASSGGSGMLLPFKVSFASNDNNPQQRIEGFSARPRTAPAPPPLKLSERPLADTYVKTPFPLLLTSTFSEGEDEGGRQVLRKKQKEGEGGKGKGKGKEGENPSRSNSGKSNSKEVKKRNRVSSLPGFGFARSLSFRQRGSEGIGSDAVGSSSGSGAAGGSGSADIAPTTTTTGAKDKDKGSRKTSPVPRVRNFLAKAKRLGLGRGLGIGTTGEEARKERRREEIKRQIRVGEPQSR